MNQSIIGFEFSNFCKNAGTQIFLIKREGLVKKRGERCFEKMLFILTEPFQCYFSLSAWCRWCVCMHAWVCVCVCVCVCVFSLFRKQQQKTFTSSRFWLLSCYLNESVKKESFFKC